MTEELKKKVLELLDRDAEFRYTIAGYLGLQEILRKLDEHSDAIAKLQGAIAGLEDAIRSLQEAIRDMRETMKNMTAVIVAIGNRYGVLTEEAFRSSIKYLVEDLLKTYKVTRWIHYDEKGEVYNHPSVVEVDVLIKDQEHILVEYKSQIDRQDVAEMYRIGRLYERIVGVKPRILIVAPTIRRRAKELADNLSVELRGVIYE